MEQIFVETLVSDLRRLISDLGQGGGLISPSVYDTAQVLRVLPPAEGAEPALAWLLSQQQADGGWGNPGVPLARDIPTLAAVLAMHTYRDLGRDYAAAADVGVEFLTGRQALWSAPLPVDIPVAAELILPYLHEEARDAGLALPDCLYADLIPLGKRKRKQIAAHAPRAGTPPTFSWEVWGELPTDDVLDELGSVGHNPTATVVWSLRAQAAGLAVPTDKIRAYLHHAAAATRTGIPGVLPTAWPIDRFEQSYALYALLAGDLLHHPALRDVIEPQIDDLARALRPDGLGFSDYFIPDGDDSSAAFAVLQAMGRAPARSLLSSFERHDHFATYPFELQPSVTVSARCTHALRLAGHSVDGWQRSLVNRQASDGRWYGDKWNTSWLYTTCHVLLALNGDMETAVRERCIDALLLMQHPDGGWSTTLDTNMTETAYAICSLRELGRQDPSDERLQRACARARRWLAEQYQATPEASERWWLNKELYRPHRVDQAFILSALMC